MRSGSNSSRRSSAQGRRRSPPKTKSPFARWSSFGFEGGFLFWTTAIALVVFVIAGGDATLQNPTFTIEFAVAMVLLAVVLGRDGFAVLKRAPIIVRCLVAGLLFLPLFQLIPLPPELTEGSPGRSTATAIRALAGAGDSWQPITLTPTPTAQVIFSLVMLLGLFMAVLRTSTAGAKALVVVLIGLEVLTIVVGVLQITSGGLLFDFFDSPHRVNLIGFFPNRNHTAVFLACTIPLAGALIARAGARPSRQTLTSFGMLALAIFVAVIGTLSRAGLVLAGISILLTLLLLIKLPKGRPLLMLGGGGAVAVAVIAVLLTSTATTRVFDRYSGVSEDMRWTFYENTVKLVPEFLPWGGGFGSFVSIYNANEPLSEVRPTYVNNAHNDYLEISLEAGVPGMIAIALLIATIGWCATRAWRQPESVDRTMALAGLIVMVLFLLHSSVDYPLRRMACAAMFTVGFALLVRPLLAPDDRPAPPVA